jgi:integrator complex subunit 3
MVAALSEPERCAAIIHHLRYAASDGLACVAGELGRLVEGRWPRLREGPRRQAVWLARKLARLGAAGTGGVLWALLRQLAGARDLWLAEQLVTLAEEERGWLLEQPRLAAGVVYSFLRVLEDHAGPPGRGDPRGEGALAGLMEREARLVAGLLRQAGLPATLLLLGRDSVRALQQVARLPLVEELWRELLTCPGTVESRSLVEQVMRTPTPRCLPLSCTIMHPTVF